MSALFDMSEPLQIYQDEFMDHVANQHMTSHARMPTVAKPPRRPLGQANANANMVLNPPSTIGASVSPNKTRQSSSPRSPLKASKGNKLNKVSMAPPTTKGYATDSLEKKPLLSKFKTGKQPKAQFMMAGKENMHPQIFPAPAAIDMNINYYQNPNGKRGLMDAAPIMDSRPLKKTKTDNDQSLPPHDSFPPIIDEGGKPAQSYAQLIGMAILRSPNRRLTLAQIYKWISDSFSFYSPTDAGWQNSIRHNLSLHKNFIKIERPKDDPGKGNYWAIRPGTEAQFLKEKPSRKSASAAENIPVMSTRLEPPKTTMMMAHEPMLPPPMPITQLSLPALPTSQAIANEPSSDATILVSDNAGPEESVDRPAETDGAPDSSYSPLPTNLNSSPPMPRTSNARAGTPTHSRNVSSSAIRSNKRSFRSMDDSGYISSLESSALRPHNKAAMLTSEADRPRVKRGRTKDRGKGRAEEEIRLLRNSSPYGVGSSSPIRQQQGLTGPSPFTPNVRFKPFARPPPSASPNTNLRIHRDNVKNILQSPCRTIVESAFENMPWSPAFNLDESNGNADALPINGLDFSIFADFDAGNDFSALGSVDNGSPVKRTVKRQKLDRSISTSALDELTNSAVKRPVTSAPLLKAPEPTQLDFLETPSKAFEMSSPSKMFADSPLPQQSPTKSNGVSDLSFHVDWPLGTDFLMPTQPEISECPTLDLSQGFERIGSGNAGPSRLAKPTLGRSYSTRF